jgi:thiamine-monophosphate kinase
VGGNLTRARETSLVLTVLGGVAPDRALRRRALVGDRILVTGELGAAALARARAEQSGRSLRRIPEPRLAQGRALARIGAVTGCIDVSDGLAADLGHLLGAKRRCAIDAAQLPLPRGFAAACRRLGLDPIALALAGGDDYELLFALRPDGPSAAALARRLGVRVSELGRVERGRATRARGGFDHFSAPR